MEMGALYGLTGLTLFGLYELNTKGSPKVFGRFWWTSAKADSLEAIDPDNSDAVEARDGPKALSKISRRARLAIPTLR
jgi:hypothetical protein